MALNKTIIFLINVSRQYILSFYFNTPAAVRIKTFFVLGV